MYALGICAALSLAACATTPPPGEPGPGGYPTRAASEGGSIPIQAYGSLHALMDQGMSRPVVSLKSLRADKNLIGLGSLSALRGEIVIIPNEIWVAYPHENGALRANELGAADETAAFLVTASVANWQTLPLPEDTAFSELPDAIEKLGESGGLNVERPFPFLIEGSFANLALKVVDGRPFQGQSSLTLEALDVAAAKAKFAAVDGVIVGFFGNQDQPEFLHPGQRLHLHAVLRREMQAGHVDRVDLARGITVRVPAPTH
jgi:acetolactate decarboxylase